MNTVLRKSVLKYCCLTLVALVGFSAMGSIGCKKKKSNSSPVTSGGDTIMPQVTNSSPNCGGNASGMVALTANASDNVGITKVEFLVGANLVGTDTQAPYELTFDASGTSGAQTITVKAYDAAGNSNSSSCQITLSAGGNEEEEQIIPAPRKRVFVTNATPTSGNFGGLAGGDGFCANAAAAAGLSGTFIAWLSDASTNAIDRLADVGPWYLMDQQTVVFTSKSAIPGGSLVAIETTEFGTVLTADHTEGVWTGTLANGTVQSGGTNTCSSWTDTASTGRRGDPRSSGTGWTQFSANVPCSGGAHLYCFEQ